MSNTKLTIQSRSILLMHLHAIKYHNFDCIGAIIGQKKGQELLIEDCVPLFHQRVMTGTCEIAFDMIENIYLKGD